MQSTAINDIQYFDFPPPNRYIFGLEMEKAAQ